MYLYLDLNKKIRQIHETAQKKSRKFQNILNFV